MRDALAFATTTEILWQSVRQAPQRRIVGRSRQKSDRQNLSKQNPTFVEPLLDLWA
jgi:hypothetical protein